MVIIPRSITNLAKSERLEVSARIGRDGVSEALIKEVSDQLSRKPLVKIKANKGIATNGDHRREIFSEIARTTETILVFQRGNVAVLWAGK
jgi:RNA-binding protein YhbY